MPPGSRAAKPTGRIAPRLLLTGPGQTPDPMVETRWRALVVGPEGDVAVETVVGAIRPSALTGKGEKALLAAMAADDLAAMAELAAGASELAGVAGFLLGLRQASSDLAEATTYLTKALESPTPWDHKFVRRYLPGLAVCTLLAPGVPAVVTADQESVTLLLAEMLTAQGRHLNTVNLLTQQSITPLVGLAMAATYLMIGQNEAVVKLTDGLGNLDDITALCLVARGVALRTSGRMPEALAAFDAAIHVPNRHAGMVAAALEERAHTLAMTGDEYGAQADRERLAALEGGADPASLSPREPAPAPLPTPTLEPADDNALMAARTRVRRHIAMAGVPGTFGGRHHRTYQPEVEAMLVAGQLDAAESLLLGLIDAVEDEAEVDGVAIDSTYYLTIADLYAHRGDSAEHTAVMERYNAACERYGVLSDADELTEAAKGMGANSHEPTRDGYFSMADASVAAH